MRFCCPAFAAPLLLPRFCCPASAAPLLLPRFCCPASAAPLLLLMTLALLCLNPHRAHAQALTSLTLSPTSGFGGSTAVTGTVTLSAAATAATTVTLASSNQASLAVPASVSIAAGSTSATFSAVSHTVTAATVITVTATSAGVSKTATFTDNPTAVSAITFSPTSVVGGSANATGTVQMTGAVGSAQTITLSSSNTAALTVPASVSVAAGQTTATFTATSKAVSASTAVTVTASYNGGSKTGTVTVTPSAPVLTSIVVSPTSASLSLSGTQQFTAVGKDQSGNALSPQPSFTWSVVSGGVGTISTTGLYSAGATAGTATVKATSGTVSGTATASVTGTNAAPTVATAASASPSPATGTTTTLSVLGADDGGAAALTYTWATTGTPPAAAVFSANGTNAAKSTAATFTKAGSYSFAVTIKDAGDLTATSAVTVMVSQTLTSIAVSPASASVATGGTQPFGASAKDQFGAALSSQPVFTWSVVSGGVGSISTAGLYNAGTTAGSATVKAASGTISGTAAITVTASAASAPYLSNLTLSQTAITGGGSVMGTVTLSGPAPAGGVTVSLSSSNSIASVSPSLVPIPAGSNNASFTVTVGSVSASDSANILGTSAGWSQGATIALLPASLILSVQNLSLIAADSSTILQWDELPPGAILGYHIYRRLPGGTPVRLTNAPAQENLYADTGLTNGMQYQYQVTVVNIKSQEVGASAWVSITPSSSLSSLSWVNPPTAASGAISLTAISSSGSNTDAYALIVDGVQIGDAGLATSDAQQASANIEAIIDTTGLSNGFHVVQLIDRLGTGATPPLTLQVSNNISNINIDQLVQSGDAAFIDASLPANTVSWRTDITDDAGNVVRSWQGSGPTIHLAWTGDTPGFNPDGDNFDVSFTVTESASASAGRWISQASSDSYSPGNSKIVRVRQTPTALALIAYIADNKKWDADLDGHISKTFKALRGTNGFYGLVLTARYNTTKATRSRAVLKQVRNWLTYSVRDFYIYTHGSRKNGDTDNRPGLPPIAYWGGSWFMPNTPTDAGVAAYANGNKPKIFIASDLSAGRDPDSNPYNFVFIDTCFSAGGNGITTRADSEYPNNPIITDWANGFRLDTSNLGCFYGWNGAMYLNSYTYAVSSPYVPGGPSSWLIWREKFWDSLAIGGKSVSQASTDATTYTINQRNSNPGLRQQFNPWDQINGVYRAQRQGGDGSLIW